MSSTGLAAALRTYCAKGFVLRPSIAHRVLGHLVAAGDQVDQHAALTACSAILWPRAIR